MTPNVSANQPVQISTPAELVKGTTLYVWTDILGSSATALTVKCVEIV